MHDPAPEDCCVVCGEPHDNYITDTCQDCQARLDSEFGFNLRPVRYWGKAREP